MRGLVLATTKNIDHTSASTTAKPKRRVTKSKAEKSMRRLVRRMMENTKRIRPWTRSLRQPQRTHPQMQAHLASPAYCPSGKMVKTRLVMLEPVCTSPMEHRLAAHKGETARRHQYTMAHSQPGAPTTPTQTTGSGARTRMRKAEVGVERVALRARERSREVDMEVDEVAAMARRTTPAASHNNLC